MKRPASFIRLILAASILAAGCTCMAQPESGAGLFSVKKDGKYGFIDRTGKVVDDLGTNEESMKKARGNCGPSQHVTQTVSLRTQSNRLPYVLTEWCRSIL